MPGPLDDVRSKPCHASVAGIESLSVSEFCVRAGGVNDTLTLEKAIEYQTRESG
jgi:hypothetical protein